MSPTSFVLLAGLLAVSLGASVPAAGRQRAGCVTVGTSFGQSKSSCGRKKFENTVTFEITVSPTVVKGSVTLRCLDKKVATEVSVRTRKCLKILLGRCKCLRDARKRPCILNQLSICAGRDPVDID